MPVFHSLKEIEKAFLEKSKTPINNVSLDMFNRFDKNVKKFYEDEVFEYSSFKDQPYEYIRTYQLRDNALSGKPAETSGNETKAEVYFDSSKMKYKKNPKGKSGETHTANLSSEEVLDLAMRGSHGGYADGTEIWFDTIKEIDDFELFIAKALIAAGIPISKG